MKNKVYGFFFLILACLITAFFVSCDLLEAVQTGQTKTPVSGDYTFGKLSQTAGSVTTVTITAKEGKSPGAVSNIKYNNSTSLPQAAGTYPVTFDVAPASGWNAASALSAGNLVVTTGSDNKTPVAGDYTFGRLGQTAGDVTAVTVTPKEGKSSGARTIYYEGTGSNTYAKSTNIPHAAGTYAVTFDVAAATGWDAATDLSAGNLVVHPETESDKDPAASDYTIGNLGQTAGNVTAVTITPKSGSSGITPSPGAICNIRYSGSPIIPQTAGAYYVTFDVDAAPGWKMAISLSAGNLTVNAEGDNSKTPVRDDYEILITDVVAGTAGSAPVEIRAKSGASPGTRTIYYTGTGNTSYLKSDTVPQAAGTYRVTFDVAASGTIWKEAKGLFAGNLTIKAGTNRTPVAEDYTFGNLNQTAGSITAVTITANSGKSPGGITIYYTGTDGTSYNKSTTLPSATGKYAVTFDVAAATNWNAATGLSAGNLTVNAASNSNQTPVADHYTFGNLEQTMGSVTAVTIDPNEGKSSGARTIHYEGIEGTDYAKSTEVPQSVGKYAVTFDVTAVSGWNSATGLSAGTLTVITVTEEEDDTQEGE